MKDKEFLRIGTSKELGEVFLHIVAGENYTSLIAEKLNKKSATINEQLRILEDYGLIERGERDQRQKYDVVWEAFFKFYERAHLRELEKIKKIAESDGVRGSEVSREIYQQYGHKMKLFNAILNHEYAPIFIKRFLISIADILKKGRRLVGDKSLFGLLNFQQLVTYWCSKLYTPKRQTALKNPKLKAFLSLLYEYAEGDDYELCADAFYSTMDYLDGLPETTKPTQYKKKETFKVAW